MRFSKYLITGARLDRFRPLVWIKRIHTLTFWISNFRRVRMRWRLWRLSTTAARRNDRSKLASERINAETAVGNVQSRVSLRHQFTCVRHEKQFRSEQKPIYTIWNWIFFSNVKTTNDGHSDRGETDGTLRKSGNAWSDNFRLGGTGNVLLSSPERPARENTHDRHSSGRCTLFGRRDTNRRRRRGRRRHRPTGTPRRQRPRRIARTHLLPPSGWYTSPPHPHQQQSLTCHHLCWRRLHRFLSGAVLYLVIGIPNNDYRLSR